MTDDQNRAQEKLYLTLFRLDLTKLYRDQALLLTHPGSPWNGNGFL